MPFATALTRLEEPRIEAIGQTEIAFLDCVGYDDEYTGLAMEPAEGERLAGVLGPKNKVLFMAITASLSSVRPSPRPMTASITSSVPARCNYMRCGRAAS